MRIVRRVFKLSDDDGGFDTLHIPGDADLERSVGEHQFLGVPIGETWSPMAIEPFRDEDYLAGEKPLGDCTMLGATKPVFSPKAVELLIDLLEPNGELLPMEFLGETWFGYNITTVLDALDRARSQLAFYPGTDEVLNVERYVFISSAITSPIFKIPEMLSVALVTEEFVNAVSAARLKGLAFPELWRSS
jgi:hypothetical protein